MRKFTLLLLLPFIFFSCKKTQTVDDAKVIYTQDSITIQQYITAHQLTATAVAEPNGLYYVPITVGTGAHPTINSTVTVNYKGYYTSGQVFDQSTTAVVFPLSNVIAGWQQGIPLMQAGGKATLLIPSALAYGVYGQGSVPPNTVLIFDVELVSFH